MIDTHVQSSVVSLCTLDMNKWINNMIDTHVQETYPIRSAWCHLYPYMYMYFN